MLFALGTGFTALAGMFVGGMRCDEGCSGAVEGASWRHVRDAWQWEAITVFSITLFFAGLLFAVTAGSLRRPPVALAFWVIQLLATIAVLAVGVVPVEQVDTGEFVLGLVWFGGLQWLAFVIIRLRRAERHPGVGHPGASRPAASA